jgi:hypothetical protein
MSRMPEHDHVNKGLSLLSRNINIFLAFKEVETSDRTQKRLLKHKGKHLTDLDS